MLPEVGGAFPFKRRSLDHEVRKGLWNFSWLRFSDVDWLSRQVLCAGNGTAVPNKSARCRILFSRWLWLERLCHGPAKRQKRGMYKQESGHKLSVITLFCDSKNFTPKDIKFDLHVASQACSNNWNILHGCLFIQSPTKSFHSSQTITSTLFVF